MSGDHDHWPMGVLGLDEDETDRKTIRRAYAARLKKIDPATDPQGFQDLREAYEYALDIAANPMPPAPVVIEEPAEDPAPQPWGTAPVPPPEPVVEAAPDPQARAERPVQPPQPVVEADPDPQASAERPVPPPQPLGEDDDPPVYVERPVAIDEPAPEPDIDPELAAAMRADRQAEQLLYDKIDRLVETRPQAEEWAEVIANPVLDNFDASSRIEQHIFQALAARISYDGAGNPQLPAFANRAWIEMIDERFGWISDFATARRKFGWHADEVMTALARVRHAFRVVQQAPQAANRIETGRRPWTYTAGILIGIYLLIRLIGLEMVLP